MQEETFCPKPSPRIFAARRDRLRRLLTARGLDAMLVSLPANRYYLSGFELHDPQPNESSGRLVIAADGRDWLATDSRYELAAQALWPRERILIYGSDAAGSLRRILSDCAAIAGFEPAGISLDFAQKLMRPGPGPALVAAEGLVESLRMIKSEEEIAAIRKSFELNHAMLAWLEGKLAAAGGCAISERELAWEIEKFFRENGAQELAFASIVASGPHAALPHAVPDASPVARDAPLLVDVGCRVLDYCSDQTRTWWLGREPSKEFARTMRLVREAQEAAMECMRPGVACAQVYRTARKIFEDAGLARAFNHGLGHGVGLETHEKPSLSPHSRDILQKGMVVTVEPGLYFGEWGGVRWENTVLVQDDGIAVL